MLGHRFDLVDTGHVELYILGLPHRGGVFAWDHAKGGLRVTGMGLDLEPDLETGFWRPDGDHLGAGITGDHGRPFGKGRVEAGRAVF